jgi:anti-sigma regulatory factor (Ser/Thr protein kinase)
MGERTGHEPSRASAGPGGEKPDGDDPASAPAGGSTPGHAPRPSGDAPVFLSELAGPDLVVVSATRGAAMALAGRDASLVGRRVADVVRGPGAQRLIETLQEVRTTGRHARNVLWQARDAGGTQEAGRAAFSVSAVPVRRSGRPASGVVIAGLRLASLPARTPGPGRTADAAPAPGPPGSGAARDGPVPPGLPVLPAVRLAARYVPARTAPEGSGGWLDAVILPDDVVALMVGSAGRRRGRPGAAVRLRTALRELLLAGAGPAEALAHLADLAGGRPDVPGAEACLARLDPASGEVSYASSAHLPPLLCTAGEVRFLAPRGDEPAGRDDQPGAAAARLPPGGMLLLGLGGPAGATTASHEGPAGLADLAASVMASNGSRAVAGTADRLCAAAADWLARGSDGGDVMVLAAHRLPEPAADWSMEFPADPQALTGLRAGLRGWLADMGADAATRADVELAVWEAAVNAAVHGRPSRGPGRVTVQAGLDSTGNVLIQVTDQGRWQLGDTPGSGQGWAGGRGLSVISQVTDGVSIASSPAGTTVVMRRRVHHPVPAGPAAG